MKKSIFLFFAAILCATNAWAGPTFKGGCVYFHNKGGWNDSYKYICISHDNWTEPRSVTVITNTQLWYNALPTSGWIDAKYMSAMGHSSSKSASNFKVSSCNHYTKNVSLGDWGFNSGNAQMLTPANGNNNAALELTYMGNSYSSMNRTITVKAKVSTDNGSSFAEATSPGTLSASSFAFTSYTSCKSAKTLSSGKITCGYTANTSLTAADADGYIFAGWYDASGNKQTEELTLSLNPTADATYYAYYTRKALAEETHDVTVSYMCGATSIKASTTASGVGVSTASEITAPVIAGYNFSNWTLGSGVQSADANANPISITTKASGDYTLTANYTEIPKATIYFVNNSGWSKIQAYAWEGTKGANPGWPGADITANKLAEKIGEYDVYSYTVEQGSYGKVIFNNGSAQTANYVWTDGNYYWHNEAANFAGDTKAQAEEKFSVPVEYDYVYLINTNDWAKAHIYTWESEVAGWPGAEMTKEATQIAGKDVYSYKVVKGTTFGGVLFNCGGDECKTGNLTWKAGKYYAPSTGEWYADAAAAEAALAAVVTYDYYIAGPLAGGWNATQMGMEKAAEGQYTCEFTKDAGDYQFKVTNGKWGNETGGFDCADVEGSYEEVSNVDGNVNVKLTATTTFTVKFDSNTKKISFEGLTPLIKQNLKYTVTVPKGTTKCYLVGLGDWNNFREMTQDPGNNRIFTLTVNDVYVTDEYKYSASKNWNNAEVDVNNNDVGNRKWSESDVVAKWKGIDLVPEALTYTVTVPAGTEECYIAGTMNGWAFTAMEKSTTTPNTFTIDIANANEAHEYKYACKKNWDYAEVNADGSSVSNRTYSANDVVAKWGFPTYTVAGDNRIVFGEEWKETLTDNDMVDQGDGTYKWTKSEIALKKDTEIKFQVVKNHSWENKWPNDPWVINTISQDGYYTITITFKESDQSITATANWTGEAPFKDFSNQPATLYFHPSFHWTSDNAEFAAYFYNEGFGADAEPKWADMTDSDGDGVYEVANAKQHEYVIICRMNPSRTENKWDDAVSWNKIETGITIPNTAGDLNTCLAFWTNCQGDVPTSECTWVAPTPLTDKNWSAFVAAYNGKTINAVVERSFTSGQKHTLCLPFNLPTSWLGDGSKAYQLNSIFANTAEELQLNASECNTIEAGKPYIIVPGKGPEYEHIIVSGVIVKEVAAGTNIATGAGYKATLKAVTTTGGQTNGSTEYYVGADDGKLYNAQTNKLGLRAIIELTTIGGQPLPAKVRAYVAAEENEATGFENIVAPEGQAMKVIENGQLIIIRGNEKFNAQGVRL